VSQAIAIAGIACRYPDAASPEELWANVLAGRRAFRRIPDERLRLADYWSPDPAAPDRFYTRNAALIEGFDFDRVRFKIAGSTHRVTDMTHWLALDTAARALADAGFPDGEGLPKRGTAVLVGNSLTGEFTRANLMRLRWPYVRRVVAAALRDDGWDDGRLADFMDGLEKRYKSPFPAVDEDTLAGGLSNTIAGRICNQFDFKGGGFTVDGACSSSLLAVALGCAALQAGQVDAAVVGGVDLSIDPFEIIGFAKTGALATDDMRVYDRKSGGFWPGEGCGILVLLRQEDADALGVRSYASIAGWGYASDGRGGITRPEPEGHLLALERAYQIAGFGIGTVSYLEGHGTGTAVGDQTELRVLSQARGDASPAALSTVKGNIGHTKAAAGVAGLIKATLAVHHQVIPPATGHHETHPELAGPNPALRLPDTAELWPADQPVRAGVSAMGFGGINAHIVVENARAVRRTSLDSRTIQLVRSRQDCELLLLDAATPAELCERAAAVAGLCARLSFAELADLAAELQRDLASHPVRAAVVASAPEQAASRLARLGTLLGDATQTIIDPIGGVFAGSGGRQPRIGYLFPGQGSGRRADGGAIARRFGPARELYESLPQAAGGDLVATESAQPRIVASSAAGLRVLSWLGIEAVTAAGHSLGELTSLYWAGALDEASLLRLAAARGRVMARASEGGGGMASIAAAPGDVEPMLSGEPVVIAGYNGPRQTVVSGPASAVDRVCRAAAGRGFTATRISVSHAFHSPAVAPAAAEFATCLAEAQFQPASRRMVSSVTGHELPDGQDLRELLVRQVLEPVRFGDAVATMAAEVDLLLEVGPGRVLSGLAADIAAGIPAVALDADSSSLAGVFSAIAAAYVMGAPVRHDRLFLDRFSKPLPLDKQFRFFVNPCELAPTEPAGAIAAEPGLAPPPGLAPLPGLTPPPGLAAQQAAGPDGEQPAGSATRSIDVLRRLTAQRAELPLEAVPAESRPLDELHFSSITVGQIVNQAATELGVSVPLTSASLATATLADLAQMLDELTSTARPDDNGRQVPDGAGQWVRAFSVDLVPAAVRPQPRASAPGDWQVFASPGHPLAEGVAAALRAAGLGAGVLLCLPADCDERHVGLMLDAAHAALAHATPCRFVVLQHRRGAAGLAKTLHLEAPAIATSLISLPVAAGPATVEAVAGVAGRVVADVAATTGFSEVCYSEDGTRLVPRLRTVDEVAGPGEPPLGPGDVLLVTGGGKGITAECALDLAQRSGAAVGLLGRSDPATDAGLRANLSRLSAAHVSYRYVRADVTSADQVAAAVRQIVSELGPVTAVLHGAGRNQPVPLAKLDEPAFRETLAPKITGLQAVLAAIDPARLRLLITFGSIIGRAGLRGQADYATANDWLTDLTRTFAGEHPHCRCLSLEWSVWAGAGMGERLGVVESLAREGISAISVDQGIAMLGELVARPDLPVPVVVMSRAGDLPTITLEPRELPLGRFLDRTRVHYPGIELVTEAELSTDTDPYLAEHLLDGERLFPAVLGLEAMAQAAAALVPPQGTLTFENVEFHRPIVAPAGGSVTIRLAALNRAGSVDIVIRSSDTAFQADHFRATLRWGNDAPGAVPPPAAAGWPRIPLEPGRDLYGDVLFQGRRFQRVLAYRSLAATSCVAEISAAPAGNWFSAFFPAGLVLGDPGVRDAFMHAIQCCVPNATLLPAGVERIHLNAAHDDTEPLILAATERYRDGDTFVYDLDVWDSGGKLAERWEGLRLQAVRKQDGSGPWVPALLGPYLERQLAGVLPRGPRCVVEPDGLDTLQTRAGLRKQTASAVRRMLGPGATVRYRRDGKPEVAGEAGVSVSHGAGITLAVTAPVPVGCDVQTASGRAAGDWRLLLGEEQLALAELIGCERDEELPVSATRVWGALECLRKAGRVVAGPITLAEARPDNWVLLRSADARIATFVTHLRDEAAPVIFTILMEGAD
jgi:enediyne polyketide synthase